MGQEWAFTHDINTMAIKIIILLLLSVDVKLSMSTKENKCQVNKQPSILARAYHSSNSA